MYTISTWEPGDEPCSDFGWVERASAPTLLALRAAIREVRRYYHRHSYLIESDGPAGPGPRPDADD